MGNENDKEGRPYKGATMRKKHVNDMLQRQGGEEKNDAHVIGLTHCQGAAPSGSSEEPRVTRQSEETFHNEGKVNLTLEKVISNLTPKEKVGVPPLLPVADLKGEMLWEISKNEDERKKTEGELDKKHTCTDLGKDSGLESSAGGSWADDNSSPLAITFN